MSVLAASPPAAGRPWGRAALWLAGLAPFFYLTYGFANWLAQSRAEVPSIVFAWERSIPFLPWTIVPYWSINLLYGLSVFVCATRDELDRHGLRLLSAQVVATICFILWPLKFSFATPATGGGIPGALFDLLMSFDRPFNQAPSLHIAILVILWALYRCHVPAWTRPILHLWFGLIGISVLTTYQHHVFDIPTGALLGLVCVWAWPDEGRSPLAGARWTSVSARRRLALRYGLGALALAGLAIWVGGAGLWLCWPAVSLILVAANYGALGPAGFQKRTDGRMSVASRWLFGPYILGAAINSRLWTRRDPHPVEIQDGVWLGRFPGPGDGLSRYGAVIDLAAELPRVARAARWQAVPSLDLVPPDLAALRQAARAIEAARRDGPVLVCCALGYSRSAAAVATWLVATRRADGTAAAEATIRAARAGIRLSDETRTAIAAGAAT